MIRRLVAAVLLSALLGTALSGCGPESRTSEGAARDTASVSVTPTPDIPPSATPGPTGLDASGVDAELSAMERELDSLDMPSDGDFGDAEGALY